MLETTKSTEYPPYPKDKKKASDHTSDIETIELDGEAHGDHLAIDVCFLLFVMLALGQFMKSVAEWTGLPYTSLITVTGLIFGICSTQYNWGHIGEAIKAYSNF